MTARLLREGLKALDAEVVRADVWLDEEILRLFGGVAPAWDRGAVTRFIAQAGNTVVPAVLAIESLGFAVSAAEGAIRAERGDEAYLAEDPVALLGLIRLIEVRSWDWHASDEEIRTALARFGWE